MWIFFADKNGDVDWNTLGNILVAFDLGEVIKLHWAVTDTNSCRNLIKRWGL